MLLYSWRIECPCLSVGLEQLNLNTDGLYSLSFFAYLSHIIVTPTEQLDAVQVFYLHPAEKYDTLKLRIHGNEAL